jgi:steroid 5-alpha reductase family enzyme
LISTTIAPPQWRYIGFISPVFTYLLLRYASGVPPLEKSAEKKWGKEEEWVKYREETGVLFPAIGKGKVA